MKLVLLADTHIPFHIHLDPVFEFIKDFKPDKIILVGDMHDWTAVSHWTAENSRHLDGGIIQENYDELKKELLNPLKKIKGKAEMIYILGNHEDWLIQATNESPNGRGYWEIEKNIDCLEYDMKLVAVNKVYRVNSKLYITHGPYTNEFHAKKMVNTYHTTILYGHVHDIQSHTIVSAVDVDEFYNGQSIGCLCHLNPHYMKNRPNRWVNGFCFVYVDDKTGYFNHYPVFIVKNKFWANGRNYA